jgi:hypothetical protein
MLRRGLLLLALACVASAAVVSIDLGSEYVRACLIKPGKVPIQVVTNEMSRRKSPNLVGVVEGDRLAGEEAFSMGIRHPVHIISRVRDMLGRSVDDPLVQQLVSDHRLPYELLEHPDRKTVAVAINKTASLLAEELQVRGAALRGAAADTVCARRRMRPDPRLAPRGAGAGLGPQHRWLPPPSLPQQQGATPHPCCPPPPPRRPACSSM